MSDVFQNLYVSLPTAPVDSGILDIIRSAERNNAKLGISGMLIYGTTGYLQLLEGPEATVRSLSETILTDLRHVVVQKWTGHAHERLIKESLPMGFAKDEINPALLSDLHRHIDDALGQLTTSAYSLYPSASPARLS